MTLHDFFARFRSSYLWVNLLAMVLVVAAILFATFEGLDLYTHHGQHIRVPALRGMQLRDAEYKLNKLNLEYMVVDSGYISTLPPGSILEQTPAAGEEVKSGRTIYLTVNSNSTPTLVLPDIADNSSYREAVARLQAMGFRLGPPEYIEGEKDWVYSVKCQGRTIPTGMRVPIDVPLILQVGNGKSSWNEDSVDYVDDGTVPDEGNNDVQESVDE
jgi:beta-lactam-binding protein with PASTA domain